MPRKKAAPRMQVGTRVGVRFYPSPLEGVVIEDRGDLGRDGEQIVRIRIWDPDAEEEFEVEHAVSRLVPPPDPNARQAPPPRRPRRRALA